MMFGNRKYEEINELLNSKFAEKKALVASHRGVWAGNVCHNTIESYTLALRMGADILEGDFSISTDGDIYVYHDGREMRNFFVDKPIETMTSKEIEDLHFINALGEDSGKRLMSADTLFSWLSERKDVLYNIDRSWSKMASLVKILSRYPSLVNHVIIKTYPTDKDLNFFADLDTKYMYMPMVRTIRDVNIALSYANRINLVGMELLAEKETDELFLQENIDYIRSKGIFAWTNSIKLGCLPKHSLYAGYDDDKALFESPDSCWGELIRKHIDVIQTDWPIFLSEYRDKYFGL